MIFAILRDPSCSPLVTSKWLDGWALAFSRYLEDVSAAWPAGGIDTIDLGTYHDLDSIPRDRGVLHFRDVLGEAPQDAAYHAAPDAMGRIYMPVATVDTADLSEVSNRASHEGAETHVDPAIDRWVALPGSDLFALVEPCDVDQGGSYMIDGYAMANFAHPAYFGLGGGKLDQMGRLAASFTRYPTNSYQILRDATGTRSTDPPEAAMRLPALGRAGKALRKT